MRKSCVTIWATTAILAGIVFCIIQYPYKDSITAESPSFENANGSFFPPRTSDIERTPHGSVYISGNSAFTPENGVRRGSGTSDDPFIIANWSFIGLIEIIISNVYFIIQNCSFSNEDEHIRTGIALATVGNGTITNNSFTSSSGSGSTIDVDHSSNINITENYIERVTYGIEVNQGSKILISQNIMEETEEGIFFNGNLSTISNNRCIQSKYSGIAVSGENLTIASNICLENKQYGIAVYGESGILTGNICSRNLMDGIFCASDFGIIQNNICSENVAYGIHLKWAQYVEVKGNFVLYNGNGGIYDEGTDNYIHDNVGDAPDFFIYIWVAILLAASIPIIYIVKKGRRRNPTTITNSKMSQK